MSDENVTNAAKDAARSRSMSDARPLTPEGLLADIEAAPVATAEMVCAMLNAERARADALLRELATCEADYAAAVRALATLAVDHIDASENDEGEDYVICTMCSATEWGDDRLDIDHAGACALAVLSSPRARRVLEARDE